MHLQDLNTPAALVDTARMQRNITRMQQRMNSLGVAFRPHVKTTKCIAIAQAQIEAGARGITVSTLKEAEQFFAAGITDILYAVGMVAPKLKQAAALIAQGCALKIIADSTDSANAIVAYAREHGVPFEVWIEIDTDGHRSGVQPQGDELITIGQLLHQGGSTTLGGVMTHAGSSYDLSTPEALEAMAEQERSLCVLAAQRLRAAGLPCPNVSVGSTPTALSARQLDGVTEVRAGVYVFFDLVMANVGVCSPDDVALSVLTTVIGHQVDKGWAIVDAGWMAMSRDRGTQKQHHDYGYGQLCNASGQRIAGYTLTGANQEHGIISRSGEADLGIAQRFPVGTQLRVLPNHACATGAQFPEYHAIYQGEGGEEVGPTWPRFYGW
ncbi:DSD1 family PLP-dependent enzyme [Polaromonas sp. YR568]|uniref:DSD1 family PLP-dependent enzyme n=1 Tax=Polaromonas sp. YR568 TaxID=1855301 RepID=UPI003137ED71